MGEQASVKLGNKIANTEVSRGCAPKLVRLTDSNDEKSFIV